MTATPLAAETRIPLPTGITVMASNDTGMVSMRANDLLAAMRAAFLDGAAARHFALRPPGALAAPTVPTPRTATWKDVPVNFTIRPAMEEVAWARFPKLTFTKTIVTRRVINLFVPMFGECKFRVAEDGRLEVQQITSFGDLGSDWTTCAIPITAFAPRQLNQIRKLYRSPTVTETITEPA